VIQCWICIILLCLLIPWILLLLLEKKNPGQFSAGLEQNQLVYDAYNSLRLDTEHDDDLLPPNPEADSPALPGASLEVASLQQPGAPVPHEQESPLSRRASSFASPSGGASGSSTAAIDGAASSLATDTPSVGSPVPAQDGVGSSASVLSMAQPVPRHPSTRLQHGIRKSKVYTDGMV
jgi:hypothetical protein